MEYVPGKTLDRLIPGHGMPVQQALKIAVQISDALSRAHSAGIVHRDLKPSNVMVDEHGLVKVLDFGLAKVAEHEMSKDASTETIKTNTSEGAIVGTAAYMSPEQAEGKPLDARSDIFSFGEVLYEMLSGRRAFRGGTNMSTLAAIINSAPQALEGVPPELAHVVDRCLKKDPAKRYQHIDDVTVALDELREESQSGSQLPKHPGRRRRLLWVGAAAVITAVAASLWLYTSAMRPPPEIRESVLPLTAYRGDEEFPSFSPDGAQVAFVWSGERGDNSDIYVKSIKADKPLRLTTDPRPEVSPAWSPDGRYIAFLRQLEPMKVACYLVPPAGGAEMKIGEVSGQISVVFRGLAWLADSRRLVVGVMASASWHSTGLQGLRVLSIESDTQETWTRPEGTRGQDVSPSVSPDGRHIAFARVLDFDQSEILVMDVPAPGAKPAAPKRVGLHQPGAADPLWTRDGRELIFTVGFSAQPSFWRAELSRPAAARQIQITGSNVVQPSLSWTANRLAYATWFLPRPDIWRVALSAPGVAAAAPEIWIASSQTDQDPTYSPDGSLIAFESSRSGTAELWIADKNGGNPLQITSLGTRPNSPVWSPDGRQIAFRCRVEGQEEVCVTSALGGAVRTLTHNPAQNRPESWSPDGKWVHFSSNRSGRPEIWRAPAAGGEAEFVSEGPPGRLSADGRTRFRVDPTTYWVIAEPAAGGTVEKLVGPLSTMGNWVVTADGIYFIPRSSDRRYTVMYYDFRTRTAREVAHLTGTPGWGMALSPDQRSLLFTMSENAASGSDLMLVENFR